MHTHTHTHKVKLFNKQAHGHYTDPKFRPCNFLAKEFLSSADNISSGKNNYKLYASSELNSIATNLNFINPLSLQPVGFFKI